ncbi:TetR/AcrR family transcriptional regulator [Nonomuraea sp. NPDC049607]|uniref:TetR/AcrR family transcriptional regulator n=1 Tax=Nonomuraea sp. NPDC049607 TaxID=3154732 RepID=UPI00344164C0
MTHTDKTTRPRRARRTDAAQNAERLLTAAKDLFDEHGPDAPLDEVAQRAGVGNATLYRHYPTRGDLLVAVYSDEVTALCDQGRALLAEPSTAEALFTWLDGFVVHIATKRTLALAANEHSGTPRTELFERWHDSMRSIAERLLARAQRAGTVRADLSVADVLALTSGAALTSTSTRHAQQLLQILRNGFVTTKASAPPDAPSVR